MATKCGLVWHTRKGNHFFDYEGKPVHRYLGRELIVYELEQSLKRLGTDHIDHYITHWQDPTTPIAETMAALEDLKGQGKIRSIGASNVTVEDLAAYVAAGRLDAIQEEYSMVKRDIEATLLPDLRAAWRVDAQLLLAGAWPAVRAASDPTASSRATTSARTIRASRSPTARRSRR